MGWDNRLLLHIGMDGPNINLKLKEDLRKHFEEATGQKFLNINTCTLHKVHTSFKKRVTALPNDIDQFAVDLHGFLSYLLLAAKIILQWRNWHIKRRSTCCVIHLFVG